MNQDIINKVYKLKASKKGYRQWLATELGCTLELAKDICERLFSGAPVPELEVDSKAIALKAKPAANYKAGLHLHKKYTYNEENDTYVVPMLKTMGKNFICSGGQHRAMQLAYSGFGNQTINELCDQYGLTRAMFNEYKTAMGWTKDMLPLSDEQIVSMPIEEATHNLLLAKKRAIREKFQKDKWKETQAAAMQWEKLQTGVIEPLSNVLQRYQPPKLQPLPKSPNHSKLKTSKNVFVVGLSDLHFGAKANSNELFSGTDFDADKIKDIIDVYATKIKADVDSFNYKFDRCVIMVVGDILHSLTGFTEKGTQLEADVLREEQFELAFNSLAQFFNRMLEIFGKAEVFCVKGNHAGQAEYNLMFTLKTLFTNRPEISFKLSKARTMVFRLNNVAVMLDHGESDMIHAAVPKDGTGREAYVQSRFMQYGDQLQGCRTKLMIQGDKHHYEQKEYRSFEFFMFGSCVTGDRYADHLGVHSRPRQNCLILDEDGVKASLHYYFDE